MLTHIITYLLCLKSKLLFLRMGKGGVFCSQAREVQWFYYPAQPCAAARGSDEHASEQGHQDNLASLLLSGSAQRPPVFTPVAARLGVLLHRWKEGC